MCSMYGAGVYILNKFACVRPISWKCVSSHPGHAELHNLAIMITVVITDTSLL